MLFRASVFIVLFKLVFELELAEFAIIFFYQCERCVKTPIIIMDFSISPFPSSQFLLSIF